MTTATSSIDTPPADYLLVKASLTKSHNWSQVNILDKVQTMSYVVWIFVASICQDDTKRCFRIGRRIVSLFPETDLMTSSGQLGLKYSLFSFFLFNEVR